MNENMHNDFRSNNIIVVERNKIRQDEIIFKFAFYIS